MNPFAIFSHPAAIILGWPAVIASVLLFTAALALRRTSLAVAGAIASAPFCLYIGLYPNVGWMGPAVLASNVTAAVMVRRGRVGLSALVLVPYLLVTTYLAAVVLSQPGFR